MRIVLVNLEGCGIRGVSIEVDLEVVLSDRAILSRGLLPSRSRFYL